MKFHIHMCWSLIKLYVKNYEAVKILRYLNFEKKTAFSRFFKKKNVVTPQKLTDLDKIFTRGTSHYGLPPWEISLKLEHFKYQKLRSKIQNSGKKNQKSSLSLRHCHNMAGTYEPWAKIPLEDSWWCPKKIWRPWEPFLGVK